MKMTQSCTPKYLCKWRFFRNDLNSHRHHKLSATKRQPGAATQEFPQSGINKVLIIIIKIYYYH